MDFSLLRFFFENSNMSKMMKISVLVCVSERNKFTVLVIWVKLIEIWVLVRTNWLDTDKEMINTQLNLLLFVNEFQFQSVISLFVCVFAYSAAIHLVEQEQQEREKKLFLMISNWCSDHQVVKTFLNLVSLFFVILQVRKGEEKRF